MRQAEAKETGSHEKLHGVVNKGASRAFDELGPGEGEGRICLAEG